MLKLDLVPRRSDRLKVLCLGAHSDDIEIGCGGTMLRLLSECDDVEVDWVVLGSNGRRDEEALISANKFLGNATRKHVVVKNFKESFFPFVGGEIKAYLEEQKTKVSPDIIFTHYRRDLHQDHRVVAELTWNTYRDHLILEYEIIKYDGDLGTPNVLVHLNKEICRRKIKILMSCFKTQTNKDWFTTDAFLSLLRVRGIESKAPDKYAEGFYCGKLVV